MSWIFTSLSGLISQQPAASTSSHKRNDDHYELTPTKARPAASKMERGDVGQPVPASLTQRGVRLAYNVYQKRLEVPVLPAVSDKSLKSATQRLRLDGPHTDERGRDSRDLFVLLASVLCEENLKLCQPLDGEPVGAVSFVCQLPSNYAAVLEVALVDESGDSDHYITVQTENLMPQHSCTHHLGNRNAVISRCAAHTKQSVQGSANCGRDCSLNSKPHINGWCTECGLQPNRVTLYQTMLDAGEVCKYMPEALSATGTHGHVLDAPQTRDNDTLLHNRLELSTESTLARDLCQTHHAQFDRSSFADASTGSMYANESVWQEYVGSVRQTTLVNMPLADLDTANIHVAARGVCSSGEQAKGVSANVIYCEEAAYMDLGVFYEVIVPLMEVEGTATICISTPLGSFNFYSELTEVRDDKGERVFNVRHIKGGRPPSWKPPEARSRVQAIYGSRSTLYRREIMGEIADEGENMAFDVQKLKRFFDKPPLKPPYGINENYVFIAMDPNGGASASDAPGSDTAIVSFVVSQGRVVIVGLESQPTKMPSQSRQMLYKHIQALRRQPHLRNCRFMLVPEANLGNQAQILSQNVLRRYDNVDVMCQHSHCYGIFTKPGDPERYVMRLNDKLSEDGLFLHDKLVCANPYQSMTTANKVSVVMTEFKRQLTSFRAIHIVPTSLASRVRIIYTGKADKDNKRTNRSKDDMCMALLFGYFFYTQYVSPHHVINKRDSHNMLRIDPQGGTVLEGGAYLPQPSFRGRKRQRNE